MGGHEDDRRQDSRHNIALQVEYSGRQGYLVEWTHDISETGTFIRTDAEHAIGDPLSISISFPGILERVEVTGEVAWVHDGRGDRPRGVGVRFDTDSCSTRIAELLPLALESHDVLTAGPYARLAAIPRIRLGQFPTPLHRAERLSEALGGPDIWFKRDDLTSFALGGNKVRKLEYLAADAMRRGCDTLVTGARGAQSNHVRITMAVAAHLGLKGVAVIHGPHGAEPTGNLLLTELLGAEILSPLEEDGTDIDGTIDAAVARLRARGRRPYGIRLGGASWLGTIGYVSASLELFAQLRKLSLLPTRLVCATGSCGTQAGLLVGRQWTGAPYRVTGISISRTSEDCKQRIARLASETAHHIGLPACLAPDDVEVLDDYIGDGYGIPTPEARYAIKLVAVTEGVFLDPVYTGKTMAGLIDLIRNGTIGAGETVVFVHTGGWPALFASPA